MKARGIDAVKGKIQNDIQISAKIRRSGMLGKRTVETVRQAADQQQDKPSKIPVKSDGNGAKHSNGKTGNRHLVRFEARPLQYFRDGMQVSDQ